jgi:hypothetical protein
MILQTSQKLSMCVCAKIISLEVTHHELAEKKSIYHSCYKEVNLVGTEKMHI